MEVLTIASRQKVKDHLISNKTEMLQYAQWTWQEYEVYLEKKTSHKKEQNKKSKQIEIIDQKIKDTEGLRQQAV